ncbi:hypothetical protein FJTKL_03438 [Diaporthe vaccinii]|uniref:Uncharacterized protein n=1 Tax=Diaporthe vaccinii TaxID=105482 RepID=A0ABR4F249_9PEZI
MIFVISTGITAEFQPSRRDVSSSDAHEREFIGPPLPSKLLSTVQISEVDRAHLDTTLLVTQKPSKLRRCAMVTTEPFSVPLFCFVYPPC